MDDQQLYQMSQLSIPKKAASRRCHSQSKQKQIHSQKYKLYKMKRSEPLHLTQMHVRLPAITKNYSSTRQSLGQIKKQKNKLLSLDSIPGCMIVINQQQSCLSLKLHTLLKQFNQKHKSIEFLAELSVELRDNNPLFSKLNEIISCCILRNSMIYHYEKGEYIYNKLDDSQQFYIIIDGKVLLKNKKDMFKKICKIGETFSQQIVVSTQKYPPKHKLQYAKAATNVIVLRLQAAVYNKLYEQCTARGHKHSIQTFQNLLTRNYLNKSSLRKIRFF